MIIELLTLFSNAFRTVGKQPVFMEKLFLSSMSLSRSLQEIKRMEVQEGISEMMWSNVYMRTSLWMTTRPFPNGW